MSGYSSSLPAPYGHNSHDNVRNVFKPAWVANSFILKAREEAILDVDPLKIQKLVYFVHGWHLAVTGQPVISEPFEAWPNGPVVSSLYHLFKHHKWHPITDYALDIDPATGESVPLIVNFDHRPFYEIFEVVWNRYKKFSGPDLSRMTHGEGTPWLTTRRNNQTFIPNKLIQEYFTKLTERQA